MRHIAKSFIGTTLAKFAWDALAALCIAMGWFTPTVWFNWLFSDIAEVVSPSGARLALIFVGAILFLFGLLHRQNLASLAAELPITFNMPVMQSAGYATSQEPKDQNQIVLRFNGVQIANISRVDTVVLDIWLHITSATGLNFKLRAGAKSVFGQDIGKVANARVVNVGLEPDTYLSSPLTLGPERSVEGTFLFVCPAAGEKFNVAFWKSNMTGNMQFFVTIADALSGKHLFLPLPATYRGK